MKHSIDKRLAAMLGTCACLGLSCVDRGPLEASCESGDAKACHDLGVMQLEGAGGERSKKKAEESLWEACKLGRAESCGLLGNVLYARDDDRARSVLGRACDEGHLPGCVAAGWMRWWGEGGEVDRDGGGRALGKACDGGVAEGCELLRLLAARKSRGLR